MKKLLIILVIAFTFSSTGCGLEFIVGPIVGTAVNGAISWINGEAHKYYEYDKGTVYRTTKHTLQRMNIKISEDSITDSGYSIIAGNNDRFKIKIVEKEPNISKLSIRINFMGDKQYAELIYKNVDESINIIEFDDYGEPALFDVRSN